MLGPIHGSLLLSYPQSNNGEPNGIENGNEMETLGPFQGHIRFKYWGYVGRFVLTSLPKLNNLPTKGGFVPDMLVFPTVFNLRVRRWGSGFRVSGLWNRMIRN